LNRGGQKNYLWEVLVASIFVPTCFSHLQYDGVPTEIKQICTTGLFVRIREPTFRRVHTMNYHFDNYILHTTYYIHSPSVYSLHSLHTSYMLALHYFNIANTGGRSYAACMLFIFCLYYPHLHYTPPHPTKTFRRDQTHRGDSRLEH
jgi:hypothetical protein